MKIIFNSSAKDFVLGAFDKTIDSLGYIVESDNTLQKVKTKDGQDIKEDQFAGIRKGSEIYMKSDILSLIDYCQEFQKQ